MAHALSYADATASTRLRHEVWPGGGRVIVPAASSPAIPWSLMGGGAFLVVCGCGALPLPPLELLGSVSLIAGLMLFGVGAVQLVLPGSEPDAEFSYSDTTAGTRVLQARFFLAGDPVPQRYRWARGQIQDVRVGFARGFDGADPALQLAVILTEGEPVGLLPPRRDPQTMRAVADVLRAALGLPSPRAGRAAWLAAHATWRPAAPGPLTAAAPPHAHAAPDDGGTSDDAGRRRSTPPPLPQPVVPVLSYRTPVAGWAGPLLDRADITPHRMLLALAEAGRATDGTVAGLELTADRLTIHLPGGTRHDWPCDTLVGAYVGFRAQHAPAELCVYAVGGTTRLLAGAPADTLRELATLLNAALGVPGSVY